ncbi:MAG: SDR family NAD(P)-dependent oxidoreductase [Myxococcota bacterium]
MPKTILITGATEGLGLETARNLVLARHAVILQGNTSERLHEVARALSALPGAQSVNHYVANLCDLDQVEALASNVLRDHERLDVLVNNASLITDASCCRLGLDPRFVVNTIAPYRLALRLLKRLGEGGRVVNVSSAAKNSVDLQALCGARKLSDIDAYTQSKLALTMWSRHLARTVGRRGPVILAVNPGLASVENSRDLELTRVRDGAAALARAVLSSDFSDASGLYFDTSRRCFSSPHPDAYDPHLCAEIVRAIDPLGMPLEGESSHLEPNHIAGHRPAEADIETLRHHAWV